MKFMRVLPLALAGLFCFSAFGQRSIVLEEKIGAPFRLAVDGYLQNSQPLRRWVLKDLPADSLPVYLIPGRGAQPPVFRYLHLPDEGQYRYVLVRNFAGELQLRYRGQAGEASRDYPQIAFSRDLEYRPAPSEAGSKEGVSAQVAVPSEEALAVPPPERAAAVQKAVQPREKSPPAQKQPRAAGANATVEETRQGETEEPVAEEPPAAGQKRPSESGSASPLVKSSEEENPAKENPRQNGGNQLDEQEAPPGSQTIDTLRSEAPRAPADSAQVAVFVRELQALKCEFERLAATRRFLDQFTPVPQAIPRLLEAFRYDQSRVDLINEILAERPDWVAHLPEWLPVLDYQMSRRKLEKKWHEE